MGAKMIIVEGNYNDKDNVRAYFVKGEPGRDGESPTVKITNNENIVTITATDSEGTTTGTVESPTVEVTRTNSGATISITDINGTHNVNINDGEVTNASLAAILANYYSNSNDNKTTVNLSEYGTAVVVRRGNVVTIQAKMTIPANTSTSSNQVELPSWAKPSVDVLDNRYLYGIMGVDSNQYGRAQISVSVHTNDSTHLYFQGKNTNSLNSTTFYSSITYVVD